jgi:hypothetical protein
MITFNDILTLGGVAPSDVKILRYGQVAFGVEHLENSLQNLAVLVTA